MGNNAPVAKNTKRLFVEYFSSAPSAETFNDLKLEAMCNGKVIVVSLKKVELTPEEVKVYMARPAGVYIHQTWTK